MLLTKICKALLHRPTHLLRYLRQALLFYRARWLSLLLLNTHRVHLSQNVRFQSLASFLTADPESRIRVGADSIIYEHARLETYGTAVISIGDSAVLGDVRILSRKSIHLGSRVLTSWNVLIQDFDPHPLSASLRREQVQKLTDDFFPRFSKWTQAPVQKIAISQPRWEAPQAEIFIGDDCWLGAQCIILKGTRIGAGSIVAAGAVVVGGEFPERSLIAGNPAQWVKELPV